MKLQELPCERPSIAYPFKKNTIHRLHESQKKNLKSLKKQQIANVLKAYKYLLDKPSDERLTLKDIKEIGDIVNFDSDTPEGFRRIEVNPGNKANFIPSNPRNILNDLNQLLMNYYYMWSEIDPFLREAMFHI